MRKGFLVSSTGRLSGGDFAVGGVTISGSSCGTDGIGGGFGVVSRFNS